MRPGGGNTLLLLRRTLEQTDDDAFTLLMETSSNFGETWTLSGKRSYRRRSQEAAFFPVREDTGMPAHGRSPEAAEFDFLLGEYDASHCYRPQQSWLHSPSRSG